MSLLLLAALALAQEAPAEDDDHVVIVYGDHLVEQARRRLLEDLAWEGYTEVEDRGDHLRVRHPAAWKGEILLYDDGWIRMKRQPLQVVAPEVPWAEENTPLAWATCVVYPPACIRAGGITVGRRKWMAQQHRTLQSVQPDLAALGDRVADRHVEQTVNDLPTRLEALWLEGVPLDGVVPLETPEERKAALLAFWDSRTDTIWGDRVRLAVEAFVRSEVQGTPDAFTVEEVAAFNAARTSARALDLWTPWEEVATLEE